MKNLKILKNIVNENIIPVVENNNDKNVYQFCYDTSHSYIYILCTDGITCRINLDLKNLDNFHICNVPIRLTFLSITREISVIDSSEINIFNENLDVLITYCFSDKCKAAEYSPGQDVLVIVTEKDTIQLLTLDSLGSFSILNTVSLNEYKFYNQFINVGWGSKETQFHGSEGKDSRRQLTANDLNSTDVQCCNSQITWRGDGTLFAVSYLRGEFCALLTIDKDGVPQYASEITPGLEFPICWKPSGNIIAAVQRLPNKYQISFFEKNGLRHGEFTISSAFKVKKLAWSSDSDILTILYENNCLELWIVKNCHWYLKQSLQFNDQVYDLLWDSGFEIGTSKVLHILFGSNTLVTYEWIWETNHSLNYDEQDLACVAVIDGTKALLTSFKRASIPPPMCNCTLIHEKPINFILFGKNNAVCVVLSDYSIYHYICSTDTFKYELKEKITFVQNRQDIPLSKTHFLWLEEKIFLFCLNKCIQSYAGGETTSIIEIDEVIISMEATTDANEIVLQTISGNIFNLNIENKKLTKIFKFNIPCETIRSLHSNLFALDRFNRFYINNNCVANNVTSFFIHNKFLLLTTSQHYLICLRHEEINTNSISKAFKRRIENGAKIVVAVQFDSKLVLQMPRGNLEIIHPRIMSINIVATFIDNKEYLKAFKIMKKERINLNLLYDHNPKQFLTNADLFIRDISDPLNLNMFLLELQDEDVTQTMYSMCYNRNCTKICADNKKKTIVERFLECLLSLPNHNDYLLTIVTTYLVRKTQSDLENALNSIFETKLKQNSQNQQLKVTAEEALSQMILLVPINELFNIALGMYNFDLIKFVASKSQKDPKQYIPFLNDLNQLDENYRRFTINKYLKRYKSALESISKCDYTKFNECILFIQSNKLYKEALEIFKSTDVSKYRHICYIFAEYLLEKRCYLEAGIMFERSGNSKKALNMFKLDLDWNKCLMIAIKLNYDTVSFNQLCRDLISDLITQKRFQEAGVILVEYLKDIEEAVNVLTEGKLWSESFRLAYGAKRLDLIETHIKERILEHSELLLNQINTFSEEFTKQKDRLIIVRESKQRKYLDQDSEQQFDNQAPINSDLYSDTASIISKGTTTSKSSTSSFRSFRSSKNRRKHERKVLSLKEGSKFEDLALLRSLHQLISNTLALRVEVRNLCPNLLLLEEDDLAKHIQKSLDSLLYLMQSSESEIWLPNIAESGNINFGPNMTTNSALQSLQQSQFENGEKQVNLEPQFRYPPEKGNIHWKCFMLD